MTRYEIIETIARALAVADSGPEGSALFETQWEKFSFDYLDNATVALSVIKAVGLVLVPVEPTDRMIDAAIMADRPPLRKITVGDVLKAEYTAMIKAALNPERDSSG
jgi:hypothetical protein